MKKTIKIKLLLLAITFSCPATAQEPLYDYSFFTNSRMQASYFFSAASATGSSVIKSIAGKLPVNETIFHTPGSSLELNFKNVKGGQWQAVVYKQEIRGQDHFIKADELSF